MPDNTAYEGEETPLGRIAAYGNNEIRRALRKTEPEPVSDDQKFEQIIRAEDWPEGGEI